MLILIMLTPIFFKISKKKFYVTLVMSSFIIDESFGQFNMMYFFALINSLFEKNLKRS